MSTASSGWHLDEELARRYAENRVPGVLATSVEQHLVTCAPCRALLRPAVPVERRVAVWTSVLERVEAPPVGRVERLLRRAGLDEPTARLVAVTPLLRTSWLAGTVLVLALALLAAGTGAQAVALFLVLAPVLPVAGVALTFGPGADPAHEIVAGTPYSPVRLLAVRTAVVVSTTFLPAAVAAVLLPVQLGLALAWLLPALALTVGTLALSTRIAPHVAASALGIGWVSLVLYGVARHDPFLAAAPVVQLACLVGLVLAAAVLLVRSHDLAEILRRVP
jgi:hypothetical protein